MKKGLRRIGSGKGFFLSGTVGRIDLMKKGLRLLLP